MKCPTTSGPYRCSLDAGHDPSLECECVAPEYATARLPCVTQIQAVPVAEMKPSAETKDESK